MRTKNPVQFRQGDVMLTRVNSIPKGGKRVARDNGRIVLAYGEVTGHAHAIADEEVTLLEVDGGIRYLDVQMEAFLRHEEHGAIALAPGKYKVTRQREYTPEAIRNVAD
jgi:hypothetical protein